MFVETDKKWNIDNIVNFENLFSKNLSFSKNTESWVVLNNTNSESSNKRFDFEQTKQNTIVNFD